MDYKEMLIDEETTVLQAMERLDIVAKKVLFIVKDDVLLAALSDGDIRRWILSKGDLHAPVKHVANFNPKYLSCSNSKSRALEYMKENDIQALPIVDNNIKIKNIILWNEKEISAVGEKIDAPVVMMAGGLGTRLYPYTKILPKPLIPVGEIPIAEHIINSFYKFGCNQYYLVVNHKKNMIKAYFNEIEKDYGIEYIDEDIPLGTGGGLSLLKGKINQTFIFTNCDILITEDISSIYNFHKKEKNIITMICSLKNFQIPYGVVEIGENGSIDSMREKPELSFFTNTGCYIVEPEVIEHIKDNTFIGFPDVVEEYKNAGKKVGAYPISENSWLDMGQLDELENMRKKLNLD